MFKTIRTELRAVRPPNCDRPSFEVVQQIKAGPKPLIGRSVVLRLDEPTIKRLVKELADR